MIEIIQDTMLKLRMTIKFRKKKDFLWGFVIFIYSDESDVDKQCFVDQILVVKYEVQSSLTGESTWSVRKRNEKQMENKC